MNNSSFINSSLSNNLNTLILNLSFQEWIAIYIIIALIGIIFLYELHSKLNSVFEKRKVREPMIFSIITELIIVLMILTFIFSLHNDSGMATMTATMILVVITGFYAWNTYIQVEALDGQAKLIKQQSDDLGKQVVEMQKQTEFMKKQFDLANNMVKRDKIQKEIDLLIFPLMTISKEIDSKGIEGDWWWFQISNRGTAVDKDAFDRFHEAIYSIDHNKHLAPKKLLLLIDEFVIQLKYMKKSDNQNREQIKKDLIIATKNLYYKGDLPTDGLVKRRFDELNEELQTKY